MAITIIGGETIAGGLSTGAVPAVPPPIVEVRRAWNTAWETRPELTVASAKANAAGQDMGRCEIVHRFGRVKHLATHTTATVEPLDLAEHWVRIKLFTDQGEMETWTGRISGEVRTVHGADQTDPASGDPVPSGVQRWVAYEPMQILRKRHVSQSIWIRDEGGENAQVTIDWLPDVNLRDADNLLIGNRTANTYAPGPGIPPTYLYGGTDIWSHRDYAEYILRFVDERQTNGPKWQLAGQADLLNDITANIRLGADATVADILRRLIPRSMGVDFTIFPLPDDPLTPGSGGFEVFVYALNSRAFSFGGVTLPRNPDTVEINVADAIDMIDARVEETADHKYGRIRIIGARMIVCCTLRADDGTLVPKWSASQEAAYKAGTGVAGDDPEAHDKARQREILRQVYQRFGASPSWDFNGGLAFPLVDLDGQINPASDGNFQTSVRETLDWIPLIEGLDYTSSPPTDLNLASSTQSPLPAQAWLLDPETSKWISAEHAGIHVHGTPGDWGVFLIPGMNHVLAKNHFDPTDADTNDTTFAPTYDYSQLVCTIGIRTDKRLVLGIDNPDAPAGGGDTLNILMPDAEVWYLAADTVVDISADGQLVTTPTAQVLRNDANRMALLMAGAIAQHFGFRGRAEITFKGLQAKRDLIGQILTVVDAGTVQTIEAPITEVEWRFSESPVTIIRTGFAR